MGPRTRRVVNEAVRFLAVGGVATLVAFVLFNFFVHGWGIVDEPWLGDHVVISYVLANSVGMVISYRGTRSWAFKHRHPRHPDGGRTMYVLINVATWSFPVACLWISRNVFGLDDPVSDNIAANVVGLALGVIARFYLFRQVVFTRKVYQDTALAGTSTLLPGDVEESAGDQHRR